MNLSMIIYVLGTVMKLEGCILLIPVFCSIIYQEQEGLPFLLTAILSFGVGFLASHRKPENHAFFLREGCIATSLSWVLLSLVGAIPFVLTGEIPSLLDALFETASGFTTTGASILADVEAMSHSALLWRSFTHWIGGMGVLVFLLAIIPLTGGGTINLLRAESPGPSVGKLVPKISYTARILYVIYFTLTLAMLFVLLVFGMPLFDSVCTALGTAGTGGFGIKNDSIAGYSPALQWVITIFMILFGVNFNAFYLITLKEFKKALSLEEVRAYFVIILCSVAAIALNILHQCHTLFEAITKSAFQVGSIITTTGFSTADFDRWPPLSQGILVLLMFIGACAGSTGGGSKVSRVLILIKVMRRHVFSYLHPKSVRRIKMDNHPIDLETLHGVYAYYAAYIALFALSTLPLFAENLDVVSSFTAVASCFNNIGPGLNAVGPTQNFGQLGGLSKCVLIFDMIAGRLEIYPLLILLSPEFWKEAIK